MKFVEYSVLVTMILCAVVARCSSPTPAPANDAVCNQPGVHCGFLNSGSNATVAMGASLFNKVFANVIPIIENVGPTIEIPAVTADHFSSSAFHLEALLIDSIDVTMKAPARLGVAITGVRIQVPSTEFQVFTKVGVGSLSTTVRCTGDVTAAIAGATATIVVDLNVNKTSKRLTGNATVSHVSVGQISIGHTMRSDLCKVSGSVIDVGLDAFKSTMATKANAALAITLGTTLNDMMAESLPNLPISFFTAPSVVDDTMRVNAQVIAPFKTPQVQSGRATEAPVAPHIYTNKDVSIGINSASFNNILASAAQMDAFRIKNHVFDANHANTSIFNQAVAGIPGAYAICPECPLAMHFEPVLGYPPTVTLGGRNLIFNFTKALCNMSAVAPNGTQIKLFDIYTEISLGMEGFHVGGVDPDYPMASLVHFNLSLNTFTMDTIESYVGSTFWFATLSTWAFKNYVIPSFNKNFTGFPLSLMDNGYGLSNWTIDLDQEAMSLGADIVLPQGGTPIPPIPITPNPGLGKKAAEAATSHAKTIAIAVGSIIVCVVFLGLCVHFIRKKKDEEETGGYTSVKDDGQGEETLNRTDNTTAPSYSSSVKKEEYSYGQV